MRFLKPLFCFALGLLFPILASAQVDPNDTKSIFRELRGLDGTWFMSTDRGDRLEIWNKVNDSTLVGKNVRIKPENGDTVLLQTLRIEWRHKTLNYITIARGQAKSDPVVYPITAADYDGYVFENPDTEDPSKIRYRLLGNRELQVTTEGKHGARPVTNEFVYEREFAPGAVQFRLRGGINMQNLRGKGFFPSDTPADLPAFAWRPGWELGTVVAFKGRGGFININVEVGLTGRYAHAKSAFTVVKDTVTNYKRDLTYKTTWFGIALLPEIRIKRDGRLSFIFGPYLNRLISSRSKGLEMPANENKLFKANNDFKKTELGVTAGFQYKVNLTKKDLDGVLGIRANLGLNDIDNLYHRYSNNTALSNGRLAFIGASLYYSVNLLKPIKATYWLVLSKCRACPTQSSW